MPRLRNRSENMTGPHVKVGPGSFRPLCGADLPVADVIEVRTLAESGYDPGALCPDCQCALALYWVEEAP